MKAIQEVLRLHAAGLSQRQIARTCKLSKGAVGKYLQRAADAKITWPLPAEMFPADLERLLYPRPNSVTVTKPVMPDFAAIHTEMRRKGMTLQLLWEEYVTAYFGQRAYQYAQFCVHYRTWKARLKSSMRQNHAAGEKLFIDYAGPTVSVVDPGTGEIRTAQIFVAVLGASSYTYCEATWSQNRSDFLGSHVRALRYFDGVPILKRLPGSRKTTFEALDRPALQPLPVQDYVFAVWKTAKVSIDYHVAYQGHFFSVPYRLIGERVDLRVSARTVEIFHQQKRVASHLRETDPGRYSTLTEHLPKAHQRHREWTPGRLLNWALSIGPATRDVVRWQLARKPHPEQGYRSCLGLLSLSRRYDKARLNAACLRALKAGSPTTHSIQSILRQGLDQIQESPSKMAALPEHDNLRGPRYYH